MGLKQRKVRLRFTKGEIKGDFIRRTKKAFKPTEEEKKQIAKVKRLAQRKISIKKIKGLSKKIDFNRLF